jgi:ankyrin repeat protein
MHKRFFFLALLVLLLGYLVFETSRVKSPTAIMELVDDIHAEHATLRMNIARRTYVSLHNLWYTLGAKLDTTDPIGREIAKLDTNDLNEAKHWFQDSLEDAQQNALYALTSDPGRHTDFGYIPDFAPLFDALDYASDEAMDDEYAREALSRKMSLWFRSATLDIPTTVSLLRKRNYPDSVLRALANPRYSVRALSLLVAMVESQDKGLIYDAIGYLAKIHSSASARVLARLLENRKFRESAVGALVLNGSKTSDKLIQGFFEDRRSDSLALFALDGMYWESHTEERGNDERNALPAKKRLVKLRRFMFPRLRKLYRNLDAPDRKNFLHLVRTSRTDHFAMALGLAQGIDPMSLQRAMDAGDRGLVQRLLDSGANVNTVYGKFGPDQSRYDSSEWPGLKDLLTVASERGNLPMVRLLLANGARTDRKLDQCGCLLGNSPVVRAMLKGHYDVVRLLVENGTNLNAYHISFADGANASPAQQDGPEEYRNRYGTVLKYAIWKGESDLAKFLLEHGARPNNFDNRNQDYSNLILAAKRSDTVMVNSLIGKGAEVDFIDEYGKNALMTAAAAGDLTMAKLLIRHGAVLDSLNAVGESSLSLAAAGTSMDMLVLLAKMPMKNRSRIIHRAVMAAAEGGSVGNLRFLLSQGAEPDYRDPGGRTLIMAAAASGNIPVMTYLLDGKKNLEEKDHKGSVALHLAAEAGNVPVIELLLSHGAKLDPRDDSGRTPLMYAVAKAKDDAVKLLLARKSDPLAMDRHQHSVLDLADSADLARLLGAGKPREGGVLRSKNLVLAGRMREAVRNQNLATINDMAGILDLNTPPTPGIWGYTLATEAAQTGNLGILKKLLDNGADPKVNCATDYGGGAYLYNPMVAALSHESTVRREMVEYLFEKGADPFSLLISEIALPDSSGFFRHARQVGNLDSLSDEGKTLLMAASKYGRYWAVQELIRRGVNVNAQASLLSEEQEEETSYPNQPETALHDAMQGKHESIVQFLLAHGAAPDSTSLVICAQMGNLEQLKVFAQKGIKPMGRVLTEAIRTGHLGIAKWALENGVNVNTRDSRGRTPLMWAAKVGSLKAVRLLLKYHAHTNLKDVWGTAAIDYADDYECNEEIRKTLP